jgi:hypothetical protein
VDWCILKSTGTAPLRNPPADQNSRI